MLLLVLLWFLLLWLLLLLLSLILLPIIRVVSTTCRAVPRHKRVARYRFCCHRGNITGQVLHESSMYRTGARRTFTLRHTSPRQLSSAAVFTRGLIRTAKFNTQFNLLPVSNTNIGLYHDSSYTYWLQMSKKRFSSAVTHVNCILIAAASNLRAALNFLTTVISDFIWSLGEFLQICLDRFLPTLHSPRLTINIVQHFPTSATDTASLKCLVRSLYKFNSCYIQFNSLLLMC
jgi:hypothetical protein